MLIMRHLLYTMILLFFSFPVLLAQTGPAGIGNASTNGLWLRADNIVQSNAAPVAIWEDASGNANHARQTVNAEQPLFFNSSALNNQPVVRLDGVNDQLFVGDSPILDGTTGMSYFVVLRPNNLDGSTPRGVLGKRISFTASAEYAYTWFFWAGDRLNADFNTQNNRFSTNTTTFGNATNYLLGLEFDGSRTAAQRARIYNGGTLVREANESSTSLINSNQDLVLGALNANYGSYLGADYAEVIHYNYAVSPAQRIIINNYLAAKYDIVLGANDLYNEDDAINGNFDHEVAGIGQLDASDRHSTAQGSGILEITAGAGLNDDEFLLWGHNNAPLGFGRTTGTPAGITNQMDRVWRMSEVNTTGTTVDVGALDLVWDLSSQGIIDPAGLFLLVDTDNDGSFADETPIGGAIDLGAGRFAFNNITAISNNNRVTLGLSNVFLPIELADFEAQLLENQTVALNWSTFSEKNNALFVVERSVDVSNWEVIAEVAGAGNSTSTQYYQALDEQPYSGVSYYRIQQVDADGSFSYTPVRAVERLLLSKALSYYPNPTTDLLTVEGAVEELQQLRLFNLTGQEVTTQVAIRGQGTNQVTLQLNQLPAGTYILQTAARTRRIQKQ